MTELSYISFFLLFGNILEWWRKKTSVLSRPGQCLILLCNSHNIYHSVFAKVVNKCVEEKKKCVCVFSFLIHTYTHTAEKLILFKYLLWEQWRQGRQCGFLYYYEISLQKWVLIWILAIFYDYFLTLHWIWISVYFKTFSPKNWCKFFKPPFFSNRSYCLTRFRIILSRIQ